MLADFKQETQHEMRLPERDGLFCLLIYAYLYISGYLWISVNKKTDSLRSHVLKHVRVNRVFSYRDEFLVSAVVVPVSLLISILYANLLAQTISEINREY